MRSCGRNIVTGLVLPLILSACSLADPRQRECDRYANGLRDPSVVAILTDWRQSLPTVYDKTKLKRASHELFGLGSHTIPLGFDPGRIGLRSNAEARLRLNEDGTLRELAITDVRGTMYYFLEAGDISYNYFQLATLPSPRSKNIGVICLVRD